jgi:hypothetical protein
MIGNINPSLPGLLLTEEDNGISEIDQYKTIEKVSFSDLYF